MKIENNMTLAEIVKTNYRTAVYWKAITWIIAAEANNT